MKCLLSPDIFRRELYCFQCLLPWFLLFHSTLLIRAFVLRLLSASICPTYTPRAFAHPLKGGVDKQCGDKIGLPIHKCQKAPILVHSLVFQQDSAHPQREGQHIPWRFVENKEDHFTISLRPWSTA